MQFRRVSIAALLVFILLATIAMPLALALCGENGQHILPFMEKHACPAGLTRTVSHLAAWLALFAAVSPVIFIAAALWRAQRRATGTLRPHPQPRLPAAFAQGRLRDAFKLLKEYAKLQKALALGLVPERHPTN